MKDEPAFINILEILALEYAKDKGMNYITSIKNCILKNKLSIKQL